jgi:hypothetical protein
MSINQIAMALAPDPNEGATRARTIPDDVKRQLEWAKLLQKQDTSPVYTDTVGAGRAIMQGLGGLFEGYDSAKESQAQAAYMKDLAAGAGVNATPSPGVGKIAEALSPAPANAAPSAVQDAMLPSKAIASIESGGKYDALGPETKTGDRAYGKYQVMGANIPEWTRAHLGQEMTPQQFVASPEAQDAVFKGQFGKYQAKYGPEGAARAWFAGEGGMNNPNAKDILGTSVADYSRKFTTAMGGQPAQVASSDPNFAPQQPPAQPPAPQPQQMAQAQPDRVQALQRIIQNPRATPQERSFALQQLAPDIEFQKGADGSLYAIDKHNPKAGMNKVGALPIEKFEAATTVEGVPGQRNTITNKIESVPGKEASQSDVEYAQQNWKKLNLPDPTSQDPKDRSFWRDYSAKRLGGAGVNVNVENKAEGAEAAERGKGAAKRLNDIADDGAAASTDLAHVGRLRQLMTSVDPGTRTAAMEGLRKATGIALDPNASNVQAAGAIVDYLVPRMRVAGTGASSDRDMASFRAALPSLMGTPGGNAIVTDTLQGMNEYRKARADIAVEYQVGEISAKEAQKRMNALPDPFEKFRAASAPEPAQPAAGTTVIDGYTIRRK